MSDKNANTETADLKPLITDLNKALFSFSNHLCETEAFQQRFIQLENSFGLIMNKVLAICNKAMESPTDKTSHWYYTYQFPEWAKDFFIYLRDTLMEIVKTEIVVKEGFADEEKTKAFLDASNTSLKETIEQFSEKIKIHSPGTAKVEYFVKFQDNPWPVYKEQFEKLRNQISHLNDQQPSILSYQEQYQNIRDLLNEQIERIKATIAKQRKNTKQVQQQVQDNAKINWDAILQSEDSGNIQLNFKDQLQSYIDKLGNFRWPLYSEEGVLHYRELDLRKNMQRWAEYYLYPDLLEIWQAEELITQEYSLTMGNIKNTIQLQAQNEGSANLLGEAPLASLEHIIADSEKYQRKIIMNLRKHAEKYTYLSHVFNSNKEIEIALQTLRLDTSLKSQFQKTGSSIWNFFSKTYQQATGIEFMTAEEKAIRCIAHRMTNEENNHYDTLFLNKNFIGDLLLVKREVQENKMEEAYQLWLQGFEMAALVVGDPLSGISTFLEQLNQRFFKGDAIFLAPNMSYKLSGRKFDGQNNLKKVFQNLRNKYIPGNQYGIFLDDLNLWQSKEFSLLENMRALVDFLRVKPAEFFVVVGCHEPLISYLNHRFDLSSCFNTHISLHQAMRQEIRQAIMVRHGASHRMMVNLENEPMDDKQIQTQIDQISNIYKNNLGAILQAWTFHTCEKENREIQFDPAYQKLPDFFEDSECIMLKQIMIFGRINEYQLNKMMPRGFEEVFGARLNRLIHAKVLIRNLQGWLQINPVILYDVQQILANRNVLP